MNQTERTYAYLGAQISRLSVENAQLRALLDSMTETPSDDAEATTVGENTVSDQEKGVEW